MTEDARYIRAALFAVAAGAGGMSARIRGRSKGPGVYRIGYPNETDGLSRYRQLGLRGDMFKLYTIRLWGRQDLPPREAGRVLVRFGVRVVWTIKFVWDEKVRWETVHRGDFKLPMICTGPRS
jgi:hypothetical protein